jgi:hypothetical protein
VLAVLFGVYSLFHGELIQVFLAMFIYMAASAELASVLAEERERQHGSNGIWTAPSGFHWVSVGNGVWRLAPIVASYQNNYRGRSWR